MNLALYVIVGAAAILLTASQEAQERWKPSDNFDWITEKMASVTDKNCQSKSAEELMLPKGAVSHIPTYHQIRSNNFSANRSCLVQLHNLALTRALYYSFSYQYLNHTFADFKTQPGLMYYYMSAAADVSSNISCLESSAVYFDNHVHYANFMTTLPFNKTLPLFAVRARNSSLLKEFANRTIDVQDVSVGKNNNYTSPQYKPNPWYRLFLPDQSGIHNKIRKFTYTAGIKLSDTTGEFVSDEYKAAWFSGPAQPGKHDTSNITMPVLFTQPYFDCGRSNKWLMSAVSPIVDYLARYTSYTHLQRARFVGEAVMDIGYEKIDINPCPTGAGNLLSGTAHCKKTTQCEPLNGFGFRRGGYRCVCLPGYRYPQDQNGPFLGTDIERATEAEYEKSFDCVSVTDKGVTPREPLAIQKNTRRNFRYNSDQVNYLLMLRLLNRTQSVDKNNCKSKGDHELSLPDDVAFGVGAQFEAQARTGLRLAHFLSNFLQNVKEGKQHGDIAGDRLLNETLIFGEVLANVMGDFKIFGSGVFFDKDKFRMSPPVNNKEHRFDSGVTREYFGPFAYRGGPDPQLVLDEFKAVDFAGYPTPYTNNRWFTDMKKRWDAKADKLKAYKMRPMVRSDINGTSQVQLDSLLYVTPTYEDGVWLQPQFKCDGLVDNWVVTYAVPFFGRNYLKTDYAFYGAVTVDVKLDLLDIDQCPRSVDAANAFKNTARCDLDTTNCVHSPGQGFALGSYRCECKPGYKYPLSNQTPFFDGQTMEEEWSKKLDGYDNRVDSLKCHIGG